MEIKIKGTEDELKYFLNNAKSNKKVNLVFTEVDIKSAINGIKTSTKNYYDKLEFETCVDAKTENPIIIEPTGKSMKIDNDSVSSEDDIISW